MPTPTIKPTLSPPPAPLMPVRHAVRTVSADELARLNRRRVRRGAPELPDAPAALVAIERLSTCPGTRAQCRIWAAHPDERVPIAALRRGVLDRAARRTVLARAVREAMREEVCWTPLLDAVCPNDIREASRISHDRVWALLGRLGHALEATSPSRRDARAAVGELQRFDGWHVGHVVARSAQRLDAGQVLWLARRGHGAAITGDAGRSRRERVACLAWAVAELEALAGALETNPTRPFDADRFDGAALVLCWSRRLPGRLPLALAARLSRACDGIGADDPFRIKVYSLPEMVLAAVRHAPSRSVRALETAHRAMLVMSTNAEVRLAAMAAFGRARRAARSGGQVDRAA